MTSESQTEPSATKALTEIVKRARSLYSLPAVAAEVIQLTSCPSVDARALRDCIEVDPALTAKILRVVNSSLFGLSREVSDLNQAIALLGTKPLKLLVLGFSLPENLFCEVAQEQLQWYWRKTLARAVAAREISEQLWERNGDDAFLTGLLQDIGVLVLLGELKQPYAHFLGKVIEERVELSRLEVDSLGFDHTTLSAALLEHWKMPELMVQSISEPRQQSTLMNKRSSAAELARILHLAEMLAELVAEHRLGVLPDLLEAGDAYCGLDKVRLNELVESLQPKVQELAEVLSLDFYSSADYSAVLTEAHLQMSELTEGVAEVLSRRPSASEQEYETMLTDVADLKAAVDCFLHTPSAESATEERTAVVDTAPTGQSSTQASSQTERKDVTTGPTDLSANFSNRLTLAVGKSRSSRKPLCVLLIEVSDGVSQGVSNEQTVTQVLDSACRGLEHDDVYLETISACGRALVLPGYERQEAVRLANSVLESIEETFGRIAGVSQDYFASAGIACVSLPVKNFPPMDLVDTAERCLAAAQSSGSSVVKSLEIY